MAWVLIKVGGPDNNFTNHKEWQLDSESDISNPPEEALNSSPGSVAWTGDLKHIYNKANDGTWIDITGGGS